MSQYDDTDTITVWLKTPEQNPQAPDIKLVFNRGGEKEEWALWKRKPEDNPKAPPYKGKITRITDAHNNGMRQAQAAVEGAPADFNDDVPF